VTNEGAVEDGLATAVVSSFHPEGLNVPVWLNRSTIRAWSS